MKHPIIAIGTGLLSGMIFLSAFTGASAAGVFSTLLVSLPLFLAGLGLGNRAAALAVFSGLVMTALMNLNVGVAFVLLFGLPSWIAVRLLLTGFAKNSTSELKSNNADADHGDADKGEQDHPPQENIGWFPAGYVAAVIAGIAGLYLCGAVVLASSSGGLEQAVVTQLNIVADTIAKIENQSVVRQMVLQFIPFFPGAVASFWALSLLANAIVAQKLLARTGYSLRPTPRLGELVLPDVLSWALVLSAIIALIASGELEYMGQNLMWVLAVPYFFLGLAVVHKAANMLPSPGLLLGIVYVVLIFTGWFALMVVALGVLEQWVGLKARMKPPKNGLEN